MAESAPPRSTANSIAAIDNGPHGREIGAIFEVSAVIADFTLPKKQRLREVLLAGIRDHRTEDQHRSHLAQLAATTRGHTETELTEIGERLFRDKVSTHLYYEAWQLIQAHRRAGHTLLLIGSATEFPLAPLAAALGIDHVLGTRMSTRAGTLTGEPDGPALWGETKADAVTDFATANSIDLTRSKLYLANSSDNPLAARIGQTVVIRTSPSHAVTGNHSATTTLTVRPRLDPRLHDYLRTIAGFAVLLLSCLAGIAAKAPTRNRQRMADSMMSVGSRTTLRALGVHLRVTGIEHAKNPRPAVFLFNHQSQLDILVVPAVIAGPVAPIAKQELTKNPIFGPILRFIGTTFIDRANSTETRAALLPVVETLRAGLSVAVAPEGTRSHTPSPAPFKKGAFHMAIQAGVPVIPVVIRNASELCRRDEMVVRGGTVEVAVLEPIDVSEWDPKNMDDQIAAVRTRYLDALLDNPEPKRTG